MELAVGLQQGLAVPQADVGQGARRLRQIGGGEVLAGLEGKRLNGFKAERLPRGRNGPRQIGGFKNQLPRLHQEPLHQGSHNPLGDRHGQGR